MTQRLPRWRKERVGKQLAGPHCSVTELGVLLASVMFDHLDGWEGGEG